MSLATPVFSFVTTLPLPSKSSALACGPIVLYGFVPSRASSLTVDRRPCKRYHVGEHLIELSDEA